MTSVSKTARESTQMKLPLLADVYSRWRAAGGLFQTLREDAANPPERLLQLVWFHQRILRGGLKTVDGRSLRVLHPGFWNHEAGPDFRDAMVQFDNDPPQRGDIELDMSSGCWQAHGHDRNANFSKVILHVIWSTEGKTALPTLMLRNFLDSPLSEMVRWLAGDTAREFPAALQGRCAREWGLFSADRRLELLRQAALVRMQSKAAQLQARARVAGKEQALWEGLFRALGYKHNIWPMHRLAELHGQYPTPVPRDSVTGAQARLFGMAGLLPVELSRADGGVDSYVRKLWDHWWRERESLTDAVLPRSLWRFHGQRPANNPQRRLALAAHWLVKPNIVEDLQAWAAQPMKKGQYVSSLLRLLQVGNDGFWSWHWTLRSPRLGKAQPLLGATRVTDLAINVILPWLWVCALDGKESERREIERRYLDWPAAEDNSVLRLARQRLLGGAGPRELASAAAQQGLIQIVRDFCENTNPICEGCRLPDLLHKYAEMQPDCLGEGGVKALSTRESVQQRAAAWQR